MKKEDSTLDGYLLGMLESLLSITEQFKDKMDARTRGRWLKISAQTADVREDEPREALKIKRCLDPGTLPEDYADTDKLIQGCADVMDECHATELLASPTYELEDGRFITVYVNAEIEEAEPDRVECLLEDLNDMGDYKEPTHTTNYP